VKQLVVTFRKVVVEVPCEAESASPLSVRRWAVSGAVDTFCGILCGNGGVAAIHKTPAALAAISAERVKAQSVLVHSLSADSAPRCAAIDTLACVVDATANTSLVIDTRARERPLGRLSVLSSKVPT
jgi:hypothetical protein